MDEIEELKREIDGLRQTVANLILDVGRLQALTAPMQQEEDMRRLAQEAYAPRRGDC